MILVVAGTRPELLKLAPCVREAKARGLPVHVHCTMQSPDLVDRQTLDWNSAGDYHPLWWDDKDWDFVVVQGDTRTAFETAVLAFERAVPIYHVEAGVRTGDLSAPYPEEGYRRCISQLARWHACTTDHCMYSIAGAGLGFAMRKEWPDTTIYHLESHVRLTGSPIVESVRERADGFAGQIGDHVLLTLHRRENRSHFADILRGVQDAVGKDYHVTWPSHPNHWAVEANPTSLAPIPPMDPWRFAQSLASARLVITDSGGVQEEACALGVPCVVARSVTDRPESLGKGGAILGGVSRETIHAAIEEALAMDRTAIDIDCFGDGFASRSIADWWTTILENR